MGGRQRRHVVAIVLATVLAAFGLALGPVAGSASADSTVPLDDGPQSIVADAAGHVWVAALGMSYILELDRDGAEQARVPTDSGDIELTLSPDGATLFAIGGFQGSPSILAVDTASATLRDHFDLPAGMCPQHLAAVGTRLWLTAFCIDNPAAGRVGTMPATGGSLTLVGPTLNGPQLMSFPGDATHLLVWSQLQGKATMYTTSGASLTQQATASVGIDSAAPDPDGNDIDVAAYGQAARVLQRSDLSLVTPAPYPGPASTRLVATSPADGGLVALSTPSPGSSVVVYRGGSQVQSLSLSGEDTEAMAWSADGSRLYVSTYSESALRVYTSALQQGTLLTIATSATSIARGAPLTLSGRLTAGGTPIAGAAVTLSRIDGGGTHSAVLTTAPDGTWADVNAPPYQGTATYTIAFPGSAHAAAASAATAPITVVGTLPTMTVTTTSPVTSYTYGQAVYVVVYLGPTYTNRSITLLAHPYDTAQSSFGTVAVNSHGNAIFRYPIAKRTVFTGYFTGDSVYSHRTVAITVLAHAILNDSLEGAYTTVTGVAYFHHTVTPAFSAGIQPAHATTLTYQAQYLSGGVWRTAAKDFTHYGPGPVVFSGTVVGREYRMRAVFAGDTESLSAVGAWKIFRVVT